MSDWPYRWPWTTGGNIPTQWQESADFPYDSKNLCYLVPRHYGRKVAEEAEREYIKALCAIDPSLEYVEDPAGRWFGCRRLQR